MSIILLHKYLRIKCSICGQYMRRQSMATNNKFNQKLMNYRHDYDIYLFERYVNNDIDEHKYRELMVDTRAKHCVSSILNIYRRLKRKGLYPSDLTVEDMEYMLDNMSNYELSAKYMRLLFAHEFKSWRTNNRSDRTPNARKCHSDDNCLFDDYGNLLYGFRQNSLFTNNYNNGLHRYSVHKLRNAAIFGQKIVIDCSFDEQMAEFEVGSAARQMASIYSANRCSQMPFDLHYCNCDPNSRVIKRFKRIVNSCDKPEYFVNCHQKSYFELFADSKLIYLTPHSPNTLIDYDHNAVYILGSLVGKTCDLPVTEFKARYEGIEHYKLPLHIYVRLKSLVRVVLSFRAVFRILLEVKQNSNWKLALINNLANNVELGESGVEEKREIQS